jgi:hypothetical protein
MEVWNWNANSYDVVDVSAVPSGGDATITVDLTSGISDYVETGTGAVRARSRWLATGATLLFPWTVRIDQLVWNMNQ